MNATGYKVAPAEDRLDFLMRTVTVGEAKGPYNFFLRIYLLRGSPPTHRWRQFVSNT